MPLITATQSQTNNTNQSVLLNNLGERLLYSGTPIPINIFQQGSFASDIAALSTVTIGQLVQPGEDKRPPVKELNEMAARDPVVSNCISLKALRAAQAIGQYNHSIKEIESFVNSNFNTLQKSFKRTLFKIIASVILYGFSISEYTFTSKTKGFYGQWRLEKINPLNPERIKSFIGKNGKVEFIEYDNGDGNTVKIPYDKCLHIVNSNGATYDEDDLWGIGDGVAALNYYKLKRVVLTQMALAAKNNATGIIHARVPNNGRTILVDSKMSPLKDSSGKPIETTKQIALNYQLQDLYKKDYIVTDLDVDIQRIEIKSSEQFWDYLLGYIDRSIEKAFKIPTGIFDSGSQGIQNVGLGQNFKSIFDSTIYSLTLLVKEEIINKIVRPLLQWNFPIEDIKDNYGEFNFDEENDASVINARLSTIASLIASGLLDQNDIEIITLIRKNLGLPALKDSDKEDLNKKAMELKIKEEVQKQMEILQMQQNIQQIQSPPTAEADYPEA